MNINKPVKSRIRLLVKTLRSGKYKQIKGQLRIGNSFCCLGVACTIYRQITGKGRWSHNSFTAHETCDMALPPTVRDWFGFNENNPELGAKNAAEFNDAGFSFKEIADKFEGKFLNAPTKRVPRAKKTL